MNCESIRDLLALSAAGLLDASEERRVAEHVRECAACTVELESLGAIAGALGRLPAPPPPAELVYQTQLLIAGEADRRQGNLLALSAGVLAWVIALATWQIARMLTGGAGYWIWLLWSTIAASLGAAASAVLISRRRTERNSL